MAGSGERGDSGDDGIALQATFDAPTDVLPEPDGSILVADTGNSRIRKLIPVEEAPAATPSPEEELGSFRILRIENFDGTLNSADNPAARGSEIALITTGAGKVDIHAEVAGLGRGNHFFKSRENNHTGSQWLCANRSASFANLGYGRRSPKNATIICR